MEHHVAIVGRVALHAFQHHLCRAGDVVEIGRLAGEALAVAGIMRVGAPPEIRRVGDIGERRLDARQALLGRTEQDRRAAGGRSVLQCIARPALRGVHANAQRIIRHARTDKGDGGLHRLRAGLAGELPISRLCQRHDVQRLGHNG